MDIELLDNIEQFNPIFIVIYAILDIRNNKKRAENSNRI